ncbi:MAG: hypothetical protein K2X99_06805 [Gemmatimonadaceae bacterium]|nr:hypothetical protein [Gemmatimonadaceae bacterium]
MRLLRPALLLLTLPLAAQARPEVRYEIRFPNLRHHEAEVVATFPATAGRPLQIRMSRSSPGRYAVHEFAKNIYRVRITDGRGSPLSATRSNPHQWDVVARDGVVRFAYTLFGDRVDGTYTGISDGHVHLSAPATFAFARGLDANPIRVKFVRPVPTWSVATQLVPTDDAETFTAPHLQYFFDAPTMIGPLEWREWEVPGASGPQRVRIAMNDPRGRDKLDEYQRGAQRIVREMTGVFGTLPTFDFGRYTFLAAYLPWASGDGMEHRNSTSLTSSGSIATGMSGLLGTVSHEFFHAWNVERLRPKDLEPFDFEDADLSSLLWVAEGFTQYYGGLVMARAGLTEEANYVRSVGFTVDQVVNAPGRGFYGPIGMSEQAPFTDAAVSIDPQNRSNIFISYYTYGAGIALALDLSLRGRDSTLSLDTFMQALWRDFGRHQANYAPARPYTLDDWRRTLGTVAKDTAWANDFVRRFVAGNEAPDYAALLARAGVTLRAARPEAPWIGDNGWRQEGERLLLQRAVLVGSPLYAAGLETGDRLVSFNGAPATSPAVADSVLATLRPGQTVPIEWGSRAGVQRGTITIGTSPRLESALAADATPAQRAFRARWLGAKAPQ